MRPKILCIEDNLELQEIMAEQLNGQYDVVCVSNIAGAEKSLRNHQFNLILLDLSLPDGDGLKYCSILRSADATRLVPLIIISGNQDVLTKITGFSLGADDYIIKPFDLRELSARIASKIRRNLDGENDRNAFDRGLVHISLTSQRAYVKNGPNMDELPLTPIEFRILSCLARREDQVYSRDQLISEVLSKDVHVFDRTIDTHICSLRKKLGPAQHYLKTVRGTGYYFTSKIRNAA